MCERESQPLPFSYSVQKEGGNAESVAALPPVLCPGSALLVFSLNFSSVHHSLLRPPAEQNPPLAYWTTGTSWAFTGLAVRAHAHAFLRETVSVSSH